MPKAQFNIRLPKAIADRLRADARRSRRSLDAIAETIFSDFFSGWTVAERARFYEQAAPKRAGRPLEEVVS